LSSVQPVAYSISHKGLTLEIALVNSKKLLVHEETIPKDLTDLKDKIEKDGVLKAPILVDKNTNVVLDGMHRTAALNELGCNYTCVCYVDYENPQIKVERWIRKVNRLELNTALKILAHLNLEIERGKHPKDISLTSNTNETLLIFKDEILSLKINEENKVSILNKIHELELELEKANYSIKYSTEQDAQKLIRMKSFDALLFPPIISKSEVITYASEKKIFIPKATRHIIPARPVEVNCSLELLRNYDSSLNLLNIMLSDQLNSKKMTRLPRGSMFFGRRYDETLYLFKD
jgi:ParB-like chromosome segregation protein Spo0J